MTSAAVSALCLVRRRRAPPSLLCGTCHRRGEEGLPGEALDPGRQLRPGMGAHTWSPGCAAFSWSEKPRPGRWRVSLWGRGNPGVLSREGQDPGCPRLRERGAGLLRPVSPRAGTGDTALRNRQGRSQQRPQSAAGRLPAALALTSPRRLEAGRLRGGGGGGPFSQASRPNQGPGPSCGPAPQGGRCR